jgi:hypothetical protein
VTKTKPIEAIEVNRFRIKEIHEILINRSHSSDPTLFQWIRQKLVSILANSVRMPSRTRIWPRLEVPRVKSKAGRPGEIRTPDPRFRKPLLYPSELQARQFGNVMSVAGIAGVEGSFEPGSLPPAGGSSVNRAVLPVQLVNTQEGPPNQKPPWLLSRHSVTAGTAFPGKI